MNLKLIKVTYFFKLNQQYFFYRVYPCRDLSLSLIILNNICASRTPQATDSS